MLSERRDTFIVWCLLVLQCMSTRPLECSSNPMPRPAATQNITIGILVHSADNIDVGDEVMYIQGCNVTLVRRYVDMRETYQWFRAVLELDTDSITDAIIVVDDIHLDNTNAGLLSTLSKPSVIWGRRPAYHIKTTPSEPVPPNGDICSVQAQTNVLNGTPYCLSAEEIMAIDESNGTKIFQVEFNAPSILGIIVTMVMEWNLVFILHENATEFEAAGLVDRLSDKGVLVVIYNVDVYTNITDILIQTYNDRKVAASEINYVVMCHFNCIRRIFKQVNEFDNKKTGKKTLMKQFSRWLVAVYNHTHDVSLTLTECANDTDNIAIIAFPHIVSEKPEKELKKEIRKSIYDYMLDQEDADNQNVTVDIVPYTVSLLQAKATTWMPVSICAGVRMDTLLWTTRGREFNNVGYITDTGKMVFFSDLLPNTKYGYNKRKFLVSTLHYPPFVIKEEMNGSHIYKGICLDLLKELATNLNFTFDLTEPLDQKWGSPDKDLNFNGMIGQLQREEVDIVAADISIQKEREMVMDFAFPFYYGDTSVLLKKPDPNRRKWRTLVDPFKWEVLMAIGITLPVVSLLAFILERFNPFYNDPENAKLVKETYGLHTFHDSFWYMYGALLSQGGINLPESVAGRTFVSCWWLFCIVIVATYCGNLIAFLTVTKDKSPFNTLEEMAEMKGEYKWGLQAGTNWEFVFKTSTRREFRQVGDLMIEFNRSDPSVMATDVNVHLDKVRKGGYGWIGDTVIIEVEMAKNCELIMMKERFLPLKYAFGFTNNSPHTKIFSEQMLSIHESGLLQVWKRRWWPKANICIGSIVMEAKPISVIDVQSAFFVAAGGIVIGACAFFIEIMVAQYRKRRGKNPLGVRESENESTSESH